MSRPAWTLGLIVIGILSLIWSSHAPFWPCVLGTFAGAFLLLVGLDRLIEEE